MRNARRRRGVLRPSRVTLKVVTIIVLLAWLGTTHPAPAVAQNVLDCSTNGFCVSSTIDRLLGLPNGTLRFADPVKPWDLVVKGPATLSWAPIEADARAVLAAMHGVPNDNRLPYAAIDEIRGLMFMRLMELARRAALIKQLINEGQQNIELTMSPAETQAVEMLHLLLKMRRVRAVENALNEYQKWKRDPCNYVVPPGFDFEEYEPGPGCGTVGQILVAPPSPPTAEQFLQYGSARASQQDDEALRIAKMTALGVDESQSSSFVYDPKADMQAAFRNGSQAAVTVAGMGLALGVAGAAAIFAVASTGIAGAAAMMSASFSVSGVAAAAGGAAVTGIGVAASLPAIVILCIVVSVIRGFQVSEDYAVPTKLQEALNTAHATPDLWSIASTEVGQVELFSTFIYQTLPSYDDQRRDALAPPQQRQPGDPRFAVDTGTGASVLQDTIETVGLNGRQQQTFMSQGWFVTRDKQSNGTWGPPRWTLNLRYLQASGDQTERTAGVQPSTFLLSSLTPGTFQPEQARKANNFTAATPSGSRRIFFNGNLAPVIKASASHQPRIAEAVQFNADVTDPDGDSITTVRWYFETGTRSAIFQSSLAECSLRPAGRVDPRGIPYLCPMHQVDGTSASFTYANPGTFSVMVMAEDSNGGISSEMFSITVDKFVPELTITQLGFLTLPGPGSFPGVLEGAPVTVRGTLNYPVNPSGNYSDLTKLVIDWGDGRITEKFYPCRIGNQTPSDFTCLHSTTTEEFVEVLGGVPNSGSPNLPRGPWAFEFSHSYAYSPDRPSQAMGTIVPLSANDGAARVKVYAVTVRGAWTPTHRLDFMIRNSTPIVELRGVCPAVPTGACTGDFREVRAEQALRLSARLYDAFDANHLITVLWGDGTSSELAPGCTDAGCPGSAPWPEALIFPGPQPKYFHLNHVYPDIGNYPLTLIVNDGGPNGKVSLSAGAASIFGVSKLTGAVETPASVENLYSFTTKVPAGATLSTPTPTCEGGTVSNVTSSSFTCTFNDVAATTKRKVSVHATIAGTAFERSLDVDVKPVPVKIANFDGPTSVIGGMTRTYTYTGTHSQFATVLFSPYCGLGEVTSHVPGSSFSCLFVDTGPIDFAVGVSASDSFGNTADAGLTVNLEPDTLAPVLTVPAEVRVNSTSNDGAIAAFTVTALDNVSGSVRVNCDAQSGVLYPIGTTPVRCTAVDWKGLVGSATFPIRVIDVTPPTLTLPASQQLNATSPLGAIATFVATAVDVGPLTPTCAPASGSTFAVGTNTVSCSATDAVGNTRSGTFTITVDGAAGQIAVLQRWIERQSMNATVQKQLVAALKKAGQAAASGDSSTACKQLGNVISTVTSNQGKLTNAVVNKILNDVARIQAVVGC